MKMQVYMEAQGVWDAVEEDIVARRQDKKALAAIYHGVSEETLLSVNSKRMAKEAWVTLKSMYVGVERVTRAKLQIVKKEFDNLYMREGESIDAFAMRVTLALSKMRTLGEWVEDSCVVDKVLWVLTPKFLPIVCTLENHEDLDVMSVEEVFGRLKVFEERHMVDEEEGEHLLLTRAQWESRAKNKEGGSGSGKKKSTFDKAKVCCYNCQEYRHYAKECRAPKKEEAHLVMADADDEPALL